MTLSGGEEGKSTVGKQTARCASKGFWYAALAGVAGWEGGRSIATIPAVALS